MIQLAFRLELLSDVVVSSSSATAGGHECLDYIPGATLLGAAAAKLYAEDLSRAYDIFHSGRVRFGPAYPVEELGRAYPVPSSLHRAKLDRNAFRDGCKIATDRLCNLAADGARDLAEPEQIRNGFICSSGRAIISQHKLSLKSAVDRKTRRSKDAHLFSYQALPKNAVYGFTVSLDDDLAHLAEPIEKALCQETIRVGRSRSAEFGWARAKRVETNWGQTEMADPGAGRALFYVHSDLALRDPLSDQPTLIPTAEHFRLPSEAKLDALRTFIRTRRYSPFNSTRRLPDLERQVIEKGSVIAFESVDLSPKALQELRDRLAQGVGAYREQGLGELWLNPRFLCSAELDLGDLEDATVRGVESRSVLTTSEFAWMKAAAQRDRADVAATQLARSWSEELFKPAVGIRGISSSQWGMIRSEASTSSSARVLKQRLFAESGDPKVRGLLLQGARSRGWTEGRHSSPASVLSGLMESALRGEGLPDLDGDATDSVVREAMILLGARMPRELSSREEK